jgi:D-alanyl-D-alanine carboxypeptidase/D-alanyl-D-alanine-endopeptidase (penicillin-binding protein 4)
LKLRYKIVIFLSSFLICASLLTGAAGAGTGTGILEEINQFPGFSGILIKDLNTQEVLFSYNEDKLFTPASLTKIFTLLAALEIFDEEQYVYPTSFYFSSTTPGEINGNLYIVGSGDPTQSPDVIRKIADALVQKYSIRHISGDIILDNSKFLPEEFLGRGWMWDDKNPLIGALTVMGDKVKEKQISYLNTMPLLWGNIFSQELSKKGVKIGGSIRIGKVQEGLKVKYIYYSETLDKILAYMMKKSDNQSAENIFRTLASEDNPEGVSTIARAIASLEEVIDTTLGLKWGKDYILVDGCGLSEYNLTAPAHLVNAISYLYQKYDFKILDYFANTKESGTLKERLPFQVWGKTGTLSSASALAGLLQTKNKRWVVFCLMENNFIFIEDENDPKIFENRIIEYIYENL